MDKEIKAGRPSVLRGDQSDFVGVRVPRSYLKLLDIKADANGQSRSQRIQKLIEKDIKK